MSTDQLWNNIIAYSLQIGLLVGLGALAPPVLRIRTARARLLFWQMLLFACLALPWVQPWRQEAISLSNVKALAAIDSGVAHHISIAGIVLLFIVAGVGMRLVWLAVGLARLAGYRRRGSELAPDPVFRIATGVSARCLVSDEIAGPVTFGWRDPVVLLPVRFRSLSAELRDAILCHELIHVEHRDWLFTFAEEIVRAVFWFHPAVWWVLGEIQLAREQAVDQAVVDITHAPGHYVDALLAIACAAPGNQLDPAPAPLFLRRRHLRQRVMDVLRDERAGSVSQLCSVLSQCAALAAIAGLGWAMSAAFPLVASPLLISDAAGVVVNTGDAKVLYRTPVAYPKEALENGVQGRVAIQASVDADGQLSEKTVVRCLRELCGAAVESLPNWQFDVRQANTSRTITIDFVRPGE